MTTEEKAKAYDEALKKARDYYDKGYMMINTALENIFPELKESEVRKTIEKQGEQKPTWSEYDEKMRERLLFLMEEENSIDSWYGCYEWLKSLNKN